MAKTLMTTTRPYILSSIRTNIFLESFPFCFQSRNHFVSDSSILLHTSKNTNLFLSCNNNNKTNTSIYNDGSNSFPNFFGFGFVGNRKFSTRATHVNDAGSIDQPLMESMEKKIKEHLNAESVSVKDTSGDGRHVCIDVISSAFEGESAVNRQRMVYKAIWEELQNTVHAVDEMTTRTPVEAASQK